MEPVSMQWASEALKPLDTRRISGGTIDQEALTELFVTGVCTDTRKLKSGNLFFALIGENSDGHRHVKQALENGASGAVVSKFDPDAEGIQLLVPDTLLALGKLAKAYRQLFQVLTVAITGSVGKTSTKEMLAAALGSQANTLASEKNFNNEIGVPMTLFQLNHAHRFAIIEMGMRGKGQIAYLAEMVRPDIGAITNIGHSHIELLGSRQGIAEAKSELLTCLSPGGTAVLPMGDFTDFLCGQVPPKVAVSLYGDTVPERPGVLRTRLSSTEPEIDEGGSTAFSVETDLAPALVGEPETCVGEIELSVPGEHNIQNCLCVVAIMSALGFKIPNYSHALLTWTGAEGRMSVKRSDEGVTVLDDCYNAGPESMIAALKALVSLSKGRRVAILGDMKELGDHSRELHQNVGKVVASSKVSLLVVVGELAKEIASSAVRCSLEEGNETLSVVEYPDSEAASEAIRNLVRPGDTVLVKGSRAMTMEKIVSVLMGEESLNAHA